ncbi:hypothetical protein KCU93_g4936, partial [Aureobasidium melanogenum]
MSRQTSCRINFSGSIHFARDNFENMTVSLSSKSLEHLLEATRHAHFGPCMNALAYQVHGLEKMSVNDLAISDDILTAIHARQQKLAIRLAIIAQPLYDHQVIETNIICFVQHVIEFNHNRTTLFRNLAFLTNVHHIYIFYPDRETSSTVSYESVSQCLTIVGLRAHHLRELEKFLAGVRIQKLTLRTVDIDLSTFSMIYESQFISLKEISIGNAQLSERWSLGDLGQC